jgi:heptosyltransferase-3
MVEDGIKRVLVYRLGSLGDHLIALPCYRLVRRAFAGAEVRLLTNVPVSGKAPAAVAVLNGMGLVDGYFRYAIATRSFWELTKLWWQIVRWRPQVLVYLGSARGVETARRDAKFFRMCGTERMVGVPVTEELQGWFFGYAREGGGREIGTEVEPEAERLARNLAELGDARLTEASSWELDLSAAETAKADATIRNALSGNRESSRFAWEKSERRGEDVIAVSVGTKMQANDWGIDNWRKLLGRFAEEWPGRVLLMVGSAEDREASEKAAEIWRENAGGPVANLCGMLTPRESAAALSRAGLFLGHDSGPMHLAAAVGTSCVAVFSARHLPRQWFPHGKGHRVIYHQVECRGCMLETCVEQRKKCIVSIGVDEVMDAVRAQMAGFEAPLR